MSAFPVASLRLGKLWSSLLDHYLAGKPCLGLSNTRFIFSGFHSFYHFIIYICIYFTHIAAPVSTVPNLSALRSASRGHLVVPRTRLQLGNRAFCVAGPVAWNSLPLDIRSAPTLSTFKNMLKTHLFSRSYFTD